MADGVKVSGPETVQSDGSMRVALELMEKIANFDKVPREHRDPKYWLSLYLKCLRATHGQSLEAVLMEG